MRIVCLFMLGALASDRPLGVPVRLHEDQRFGEPQLFRTSRTMRARRKRARPRNARLQTLLVWNVTCERTSANRLTRRLLMGNIQIKKNGPQQGAMTTPAMPALDPSRWFSRMMGWDPFREMAPFFTEEQRITFDPAFEVKETKDGYTFKADVPGVNLADIDVALKGNRLTISGKREAEKEDKGETYYTYERSYGSFARTFTLPDGINETGIAADLRDGVLSVVVP